MSDVQICERSVVLHGVCKVAEANFAELVVAEIDLREVLVVSNCLRHISGFLIRQFLPDEVELANRHNLEKFEDGCSCEFVVVNIDRSEILASFQSCCDF